MLLRGMVIRNSTFVLAGVEAAGAIGQRLGAARGRRWGERCKQERKLSHSSQPREPSLDRETETPDSRSRRRREYCPVHRRPRPSDPASRACDRRVARKIPACSKSLRRPRRTQPGLARRPENSFIPCAAAPSRTSSRHLPAPASCSSRSSNFHPERDDIRFMARHNTAGQIGTVVFPLELK
jgi:hypothetical protein